MDYEIETYKQDGLEIGIFYDDLGHHMYDDLWYDVNFISNHREYRSEGQFKELSDIPDGYEIVNVFAYIHGGIALSTSKHSCQWDSGFFGFLVFKKGEFGDDNIGVEGFVKEWTAILNNHIYAYIITDDTLETLSASGCFTDMDYMKEIINEEIAGILHDKKLRKQNKIKTYIKHNVPLQKRTA